MRGGLPKVNEMSTEGVGGSYNVNVDIKLASLRNDYAFNIFLQKILSTLNKVHKSNLTQEC